MNPFVIYTDTGCDLPATMLEELNVKAMSLSFRFDGSEQEYFSGDMPEKDFYDAMRAAKVAKTAAVNPEIFKAAFEKDVKAGCDLL